jgi:hypothetical protein
MMEHFANLVYKYENLCLGPECANSGYQRLDASILLHWSQNDI